MVEYCTHEKHGGVCALTDGYCNLGACQYEELKEFAPVRHGKWMPFHAEFAGDIQYCSVCEIGFSDRTAYCPHCGAVMDGWRKEAAENE